LVVGFQRRRRPDAVDVLVQVHGRVRVLRVAGRRGQQRPEIREPTYRLVEARGALVEAAGLRLADEGAHLRAPPGRPGRRRRRGRIVGGVVDVVSALRRRRPRSGRRRRALRRPQRGRTLTVVHLVALRRRASIAHDP
jgi:hypothetical protein